MLSKEGKSLLVLCIAWAFYLPGASACIAHEHYHVLFIVFGVYLFRIAKEIME